MDAFNFIATLIGLIGGIFAIFGVSIRQILEALEEPIGDAAVSPDNSLISAARAALKEAVLRAWLLPHLPLSTIRATAKGSILLAVFATAYGCYLLWDSAVHRRPDLFGLIPPWVWPAMATSLIVFAWAVAMFTQLRLRARLRLRNQERP